MSVVCKHGNPMTFETHMLRYEDGFVFAPVDVQRNNSVKVRAEIKLCEECEREALVRVLAQSLALCKTL